VTLQPAPLARMPSHSGSGVFIEQVVAGSGLKVGERITAVGAAPVNTLEDVATALAAAQADGREAVIVYVETPLGGERHVAVRLNRGE